MNPSATNAEVTITAYGTDGKPLSANGFTNPAKITVPAGQQYAKLVSQIFGASVAPDTIAWFQATSPADYLTGFFLLLNLSITSMDGADLPVSGQKLIFNHVRTDSGFTTELDIANPGSKDANIQIQLMGSAEAPIIKGISIPAKGVARLDVATFFGLTDTPAGAYVVLDSDAEIIGFELVRVPGGDIYGLNARLSSERLSTLFFLQLSVLGSNTSELGVANYSADPVILTISASKPDGTLYDSTDLKNNPVTRSLTGGASLRESIAAMFGFHGDQALDGSITVKSTSEAINGYITYGIPSSGAAAALTSSAQGRKRAIFSQIATSAGFYTGLTLFNPGSLAANIRVMVLKPSGDVVGAYDGVLQPGQQLSKHLGSADFIPQANNQSGGLIWVKSDLPLYLSSIIGTSHSLANIPPQDAPETYNPDSALPAVKMKPVLAIVPPGLSQRFQVEGAGQNAAWKVNGVAGGSEPTGTISSQGVFSAPKSIPSRQVVTITADINNQTAGASADLIAKSAFISELRVVQSVVYLQSLARIYDAELVSLTSSAPSVLDPILAAGFTSSQIFDISPTAAKTPIITINGENIVKIISLKISDAKEYLLLLGQTGGRIIRLDPTTKELKEVASGLNAPTAMVIDPVTNDLLVAEKDKVSKVARSVLLQGLSFAPEAGKSEGMIVAENAAPPTFTVNGPAGVAVDKCTGKIYISISTDGSILEFDPGTAALRTVVTGLKAPGQLLGIYRRGVTCPDSFHLLIAETGAGKVDLFVPSSGVLTEWVDAPGIADLAFVPIGNPFTNAEGVLLADYTTALNGNVYLVPLNELYDGKPANPADKDLLPVYTDLAVSQAHSPAFIHPGWALEFKVTVTNQGPVKATGIILVDNLPQDSKFVSATPSQGSCGEKNGRVRCDIGSLDPGTNATISIVVNPSYFSTQGAIKIANTAIVAATQVDPDPTNDFSTSEATILASEAVRFDITRLSTPLNVGSSSDVTVTARDDQGHVATSYVGEIIFTSTDPEASLPYVYTLTLADKGTHTFSKGVTLRAQGLQTITVHDTSNSSIAGSVQILVVGPPSRLVLSGLPASVVAGSTSNVTVTIQDSLGNTVTNYTGTVRFSSSDSNATLPADYTFRSSDLGQHTFPVTLRTAAGLQYGQFVFVGDINDEGLSASQNVAVTPAAVATLQVSGITALTFVGALETVSVIVFDRYGNLATNFTGTIHFTSTDGLATLPANYTFVQGDAGFHTFVNSVIFGSPGPPPNFLQTVTATIVGSPTITGSQTVEVTLG